MKLSKSVVLGVVVIGLPILAEATTGFYQSKYRWRNDNGSESGATWKAAANTSITGVKRGDSIRLRFAATVELSMSEPVTSLVARLEYAESSTNGPWNVVDASGAGTAAFEMMPTPWYANGEAATEQISIPVNDSDPSPRSYAGGMCVELPSNTPPTAIEMFGAQAVNLEYCIRPGPTAKGNTTYYFRLTDDGRTFAEYDKFAQLTIENTTPAAAPSIVVSNQTLSGGVQWYYQLYVTGTRPMTYGAQGLPAGITRTGTILSGRPTAYGTFPVSVTASNASGSDTKVLTLIVSEPSAAVIVDDQDKSGISRSGDVYSPEPFSAWIWGASATSNLAWNGMCLYSVVPGSAQSPLENQSAQRVWFRWTPDVPQTAQYDVYARWTSAELRGRNVPYTISHAGGTNEVFVNQRDPALSAQWNLLGRYTFNLGTSGWVELGGNDGEACADAIRFVRVGAFTDADGDGMDDNWEVTYLGGTNASPTVDEDTDGSNNLSEYLAGTHPKNASSVLAFTALTALPGQVMDLTWFSVTGKTYRIEKSTNLLDGFTVTEASGIAATPPINTNAVTLGTGGRGFYRVKLEIGN